MSSRRRLAVYGVGLFSALVAGELSCRVWRPLVHASSHRSLFKAALLEQHLPVNVVFFGTSRTGEALRPGPFTQVSGKSAFNVSTPFSSIEILDFVARRFASSPFDVAVIEVTEHQNNHKPLPWLSPAAPGDADFDARAFAWLEQQSALVSERKVLVLDSLARLFVAAAFGWRFDGTEEYGTDYVRAIFGRSADVPGEADDCAPRPLDPPPSGEVPMSAERDVYAGIAREFAAHGKRVVFYVPPRADVLENEETREAWRAMRASLHELTQAPVLDYSTCALAADAFRDPTHLSHSGGSAFSRRVAKDVGDALR